MSQSRFESDVRRSQPSGVSREQDYLDAARRRGGMIEASPGGRYYEDRQSERDGERIGIHRGKGPKGYRRSDERIREEVCEALAADPFVDAADLEVGVHDGEVTLSGSTSSREAKRRAGFLAECAAGVRDVFNRIRTS